MNYVKEEAGYRLPRFAISMALALVFWGAGLFIPSILEGVSEVGRFLTWVMLVLVAGVFLVRALFDALVLGDKTVEWFLKHLSREECSSGRRVLKDLTIIVAIILVAAAVSPFFSNLGGTGNWLQILTTYIALGGILLFVYDIGRTFYQIGEEKANSVADWLLQSRSEEAE
ncbi:MAG: hypothetical protein JSV64_07120 [Candidatus Bathyarchaeota archaeon]|nr:MAG: hypothetical protein JSV64_07120 [Candidatus Bathyarchaeota archaeon]